MVAVESSAERPPLHAFRPGAVLWLLCFQYFAAEQIARLACTSPYSMRRNVISDLGAVHCGIVDATGKGTAHTVCSPLHWLMNGSFILQGLLIFFGAVLVRKAFPQAARYTTALGLLAVAGIGVLVVGLAPEDVQLQAHSAGAAANFIAGGLGMLLLGIAFLRDRSEGRIAGGISLAAGSICLLGTALLALRGTAAWSNSGLPIGTIERIAAYPLPLWLTGMGCGLLAGRRAQAITQRETVE